MKWIKTAIGAVIAISIIPLLVLSVINIKKSLETETITFEMDYLRVQFERYIFNSSNLNDYILSYNELNDYFEKGYTITNLYDYTNDITITISNWSIDDAGILSMVDNNSVGYSFSKFGNMDIDSSYDSIYNVNASDIVLIDIILTKNLSKNLNLVATLISFVPLIFVGGVVLFYYKPFKKD